MITFISNDMYCWNVIGGLVVTDADFLREGGLYYAHVFFINRRYTFLASLYIFKWLLLNINVLMYFI